MNFKAQFNFGIHPQSGSKCPSVDIVTNVKQRKQKQKLAQSLTRRQNEITRIFTIMSENLLHSDDYVSVVHVLPHFQVCIGSFTN